MVNAVRYLVKKFYVLCAILLIGLAVLVQGGRSLTPFVEQFPDELAAYLSQQLGLEVRLDAIRGEWTGLKPSLHVDGLQVSDGKGNQLLRTKGGQLELDLISSVRHWSLVWGKIELNAAELSLRQNQEGDWLIPRAQRGSGIRPDDLWNFVRLGTRVEFRDTHLNLRLATGESLSLVAPRLLLENRDDFHRLTLRLNVGEPVPEPGSLDLVIEGHGDATSLFGLDTRGYLEFNQFPALAPFRTLETAFLPEGDRSGWLQDGRVNARLWFDRVAASVSPREAPTGQPTLDDSGQGYQVQGTVSLHSANIPIQGREVSSLVTNLKGWWSRAGAWNLAIHNFRAQWGGESLKPVNLGIKVAGPQAPIEVMTNRLELGYWAGLLNQAGLLDARLAQVVRTLDPQGELLNTRLRLPRNEQGDWAVKTELNQVAVQPWKGVPGLSGVSGYLAADKTGGHLDLDSRDGFSMHYAKTYDGAMNYDQARGQVAWHLRPEQNQIYVNSSELKLQGPRESATGSMWLSLPWKRNTGDLDLTIQVKTRDMAAGLYPKYLPKKLPEVLRDWLNRSVSRDNPGRVSDGHFVFRGTLNTPNAMARTHQLDLTFENTDLNYHPDWPSLVDASGRLWVDDVEVEAKVDKGRLYQSELSEMGIKVNANPEGEGLLLSIEGRLDGTATDGLRLLRESPLRDSIGAALDGWRTNGDLQTRLSLGIPLRKGEPGMHQDLVVDLKASRLFLERFNLALRDVEGRIRYTDQARLSAEKLSAKVFGKPTSISITSGHSPDRLPQTRIKVEGSAGIDRLLEWTQRPALHFAEGKLDYEAQIELTHGTAENRADDEPVAAVGVNSNLQGVAIDLPAPFGKSAEESRVLHLNTILGQETALVDLHYGELLQGLAQFSRDGYRLLNANLALGEPASLPTDGRLHLSGTLDRLDLDTWKATWRQYQRRAETSGESSDESSDGSRVSAGIDILAQYTKDLTLSADIRLEEQRFGVALLKDLELGLESRPQGWHLSFANAAMRGELDWFENPGRPAVLALEYLRITPEWISESGQGSITEAFDPSQVPAARISVEDLTIKGEDYGHWSFKLDSDPETLRFADIEGEVRGLHLSGLDDEQGASIVWRFGKQKAEKENKNEPTAAGNQSEMTRFSGLFKAGDMGQVLRRWGQPNILESESAQYEVRVNWDGPPWAGAPEKLRGDIRLALDDGRFRRNPAGGSDGLLRLFAILNFDSLARRLRLDFSDLYQSGLAYDTIRGRAQFNNGLVQFDEPLRVRSPSSRLQLTGDVDLTNELLNARLIATLPVAGNLTFLTALVGGLPAAAGVFLVSKLFERQVDQATSISYTIKGDWDDPTIEFDRLFEGDAR